MVPGRFKGRLASFAIVVAASGCGTSTSKDKAECGTGTRLQDGTCVGTGCTVVETESEWIFTCPDGSAGVIPKGGGGNDAGAAGADDVDPGAGRDDGATGGDSSGGSSAGGRAGRGGTDAGEGGEDGTPSGGAGNAGMGGSGVGGSGVGGSGVGGMAGAAGQAGAGCTPGALGCPCLPGSRCNEGLACRAQTCASVPTPPTTTVEGHFELPPGFFDVVLDPERKRLFASYGGDGIVQVLDLDDGDITTVTTGHRAEHMHFDAERDEVVIALPVQAHSAYWWNEDQEGYVAAIDANTLADPEPIWIPLDPWQIVADGRGHAVVSGGSGQWTNMLSVNLETEWTQSVYGPYHQTKIRIHPARDRIYGADTALSPSDIERYNLSAEGVVSTAYDSVYHGDYPMCGDLRIHPSGSTIYTPCGHIFLSSNSQSSDMTHVASMGVSWTDLGFDATGRYALILAASARALYIYDTETLSPGSAIDVDPADRILVGEDYFVLLRQATRGAIPFTDVELVRLTFE